MKNLYTKEDVVTTSILTVIAPFLMVGLYLLLAAYFGWAIWCLWAWFVVPLGAPELAFWNASGLAVLIMMLNSKGQPKRDDRETDTVQAIMLMFIPVAAVVTGWIIQTWFM